MANIELVIKIDEDTCHRIISGFSNEDDAVLFANLLKKGTPLPKGHERLIEDTFDDKAAICRFCDSCVVDLFDIRHAPTIIEADNENESEDKE